MASAPNCFNAAGVVFALTPAAGGRRQEKVLHTFNPNTVDGAYPQSGRVLDASGNLYGTTPTGGTHSANFTAGGTAFELKPASGVWTEKILHNFGKGNDGNVPLTSLIRDAAGNLYGTTSEGGASGGGTVFEITP